MGLLFIRKVNFGAKFLSQREFFVKNIKSFEIFACVIIVILFYSRTWGF